LPKFIYTIFIITLSVSIVIYSTNVPKRYVLGPLSLASSSTRPTLEWQKTYNDSLGVSATSVIQTDDGGYAIVGYGSYKGPSPGFLVKVDDEGNMQWNKSYD
jgi:hypothetical protein